MIIKDIGLKNSKVASKELKEASSEALSNYFASVFTVEVTNGIQNSIGIGSRHLSPSEIP